MEHSSRADRPAQPESLAPAASPSPIVDSTALLAGRRELLIRHGDSLYRLRVTSTNKLILTK